MTNETDILNDLYKHDLAACEVYKDVIAAVNDPDVKDALTDFLHDHERHVKELATLLKGITKEKPSEWRDLKGILLAGYSTVMSMTGEKNALKALQTAEKVVLERYYDARQIENLSSKALELINKNLKDEEKHSRFVNAQLETA